MVPVSLQPDHLPSGQTLIRPKDLYNWLAGHVTDDAEAVVVGGNGSRAVGMLEQLEETLGRPVLTANQVLLWAALHVAHSSADAVTGYGRLFAVGERSAEA